MSARKTYVIESCPGCGRRTRVKNTSRHEIIGGGYSPKAWLTLCCLEYVWESHINPSDQIGSLSLFSGGEICDTRTVKGT